MAELIKVGMADYKTGRAPDSLISYGLGSCIGIALYDISTKIRGLAHIMLPDSSQARSKENPAKFAGGAQMFSFTNTTDIMRIGERNAEAVRFVLKKLDIRLISDDTGGNYGRTVELKLEAGIYRVKTIDKGEKDI